MKYFIGIDLGTTYSAVAFVDENGTPKIIHNDSGHNITPSCVQITSGNKVEVGEQARKYYGVPGQDVLARFKRKMGKGVSYTVNDKEFTPTTLSSLVLKKMAEVAKSEIGQVSEAVVTIPANFSHEAREATMAAAKSAGLNVRYIINEPTAAALYYAFKNGESLRGKYAVFDLGGGTFDISIIDVSGQDVEVIATNGLDELGGDDFDRALQRLVFEKYERLYGETLEPEDYTLTDAEEDKKALSKRDAVSMRIARKMIEVSRAEFEESISSLLSRVDALCEGVLYEADMNVDELAGVFLVGGSTRIPVVQNNVRRIFGKEPISTVNVDEVVALGAALYAAYKGDAVYLNAAQKAAVGSLKVQEATSKYFGTLSLDSENNGPDELVNSIIISKGASIPCSESKSFYTVYEDQTEVRCRVTESSAPETDPRFVKITWDGILELPSGRPAGQEVKVTYSYDENQIMKCSFTDVASGRVTKIDLRPAEASDSSVSDIEKFLVE